MTSVPKKIGKYEVLEAIGRGSMGTVYSAHDPFSDRVVALKVAHPQYVDKSEAGQRFVKLFFNEAHAAGLLDHPNILKIFDADADGDTCYLVMEHIEAARTLELFTQAQCLLPVREVVGFVFKAAKALDYAHRQGVIHRDVKPSNMLVNMENDIKLADFSIAMVTRADFGQTQFTGVLGSPLYMSPEQINDEELAGTSDIFALGAVMYQLLTGAQPFRAESFAAISHKITHEDPPSLESIRRDLPEGLAYTVRRMLKKRPQERYQSGLDLAADLAIVYEDLDSLPGQDPLREKFALIKQLAFFRGFSDADLWELLRACQWQDYPPGTEIITEGEADQSFYIIISGVVAIEKNGRHVESLQDGMCFGEMGYLSKARRTASVIAKAECSVMKVNAETIDSANQSTQLRFHKVFVKTLIERLTYTTGLLTEISSF